MSVFLILDVIKYIFCWRCFQMNIFSFVSFITTNSLLLTQRVIFSLLIKVNICMIKTPLCFSSAWKYSSWRDKSWKPFSVFPSAVTNQASGGSLSSTWETRLVMQSARTNAGLHNNNRPKLGRHISCSASGWESLSPLHHWRLRWKRCITLPGFFSPSVFVTWADKNRLKQQSSSELTLKCKQGLSAAIRIKREMKFVFLKSDVCALFLWIVL